MIVNIVSLGKNKDNYIKEALNEFLKRLEPYCETIMTVLPDTPLTKTSTPEIVIKKEGETLNKYLDDKIKKSSKKLYVISLDPLGESHSSESFAQLINDKSSLFEIVFIIGGVYGISNEIKNRSKMLLSLSSLTFTHQMTRIILIEQIYRAFTILKGKKYHY